MYGICHAVMKNITPDRRITSLWMLLSINGCSVMKIVRILPGCEGRLNYILTSQGLKAEKAGYDTNKYLNECKQ